MEILGAARAVGVSRSRGNNWSLGYNTHRHGQLIRFGPLGEQLIVREIAQGFGRKRSESISPICAMRLSIR